MGSSMWECPPMRKNLPVQRLLQDITVGHRTVGLTKGICLVLDAEHGQVLLACILQCTLSLRCYPDDGALAYWENLTVHLILSFTLQDDVELLVSLVGVQETAVLTRNQGLEAQLTAGCTYCLTSEHLALYGDRTHWQYMLYNLIHLTYTHCGIVLSTLDSLNLFHLD